MRLLYADVKGNFYDLPGARPAARTGDRFLEVLEEDLVDLPAGATLVAIPGGLPVAVSARGRFYLVERDPVEGDPVYAVGALLPQGYTRSFLPAYRRPGGGPSLPLFGYTAVAWHRGRIRTAAMQTDDGTRWDPRHYNTQDLPELVGRLREEHPANRLVRHLAACALDYGCFTAQNIFYRRWEGGIPVSRACNAGCLGCISRQEAECCPAPQSRISFTPDAGEVADLAASHFQGGGDIISFGQGCEGEPSLEAELIAGVVAKLRRLAVQGTVNVNTNAGFREGIDRISRAGVDSLRVSLISAREEVYRRYTRPSGYSLTDVRESIINARSLGVRVALNLLVMPGLTDRQEEMEALTGFIRETGVSMVQLRNLNIDPDFLWDRLMLPENECLGIKGMVEELKSLPGVEVGNFTRPKGQKPGVGG